MTGPLELHAYFEHRFSDFEENELHYDIYMISSTFENILLYHYQI